MRYILLFIHALTISIYSLFLADPVTVRTNIPAGAKPGTEFTAEITIAKGQLAGFAKFQLELPPGMTAREGDSKGGTFTMAGQTAKIIWTSVPSSAEFTITMTIAVDAAASGEKIITGKYSYIENNVKQQVEIQPATVQIDAGAVATNTVTPTATVAPEGSAAISVTRNITVGSQGEYEVELKVKKDAVKGFAKLEEKIPAGFTAVGGKTDESSFSFSEQEARAKFIWTSLPEREELTLSYKLVPGAGTPPSPSSLEGEFSYLEDQQSKLYAIARQDLPGTTPAVATNTATTEPTNTVTTEPVNTTTTAAIEPAGTQTATSTEPVTTATTAPTNTTAPVDMGASQKNSNVYYSVQIGAYRKAISVDALASRFSLSGVSTEMHGGLNKFVIGKHDEYRQARDARETVRGKGATDAFVTAYNLGRRITVQEALMISNQKWFR
jgi:cell division protein FtsN